MKIIACQFTLINLKINGYKILMLILVKIKELDDTLSMGINQLNQWMYLKLEQFSFLFTVISSVLIIPTIETSNINILLDNTLKCEHLEESH